MTDPDRASAEKLAKKLFEDEIISFIDGYYLGGGGVEAPIVKAVAAFGRAQRQRGMEEAAKVSASRLCLHGSDYDCSCDDHQIGLEIAAAIRRLIAEGKDD